MVIATIATISIINRAAVSMSIFLSFLGRHRTRFDELTTLCACDTVTIARRPSRIFFPELQSKAGKSVFFP